MKIFRIYNPSENKYAISSHMISYGDRTNYYNVTRKDGHINYSIKGKSWKSSAGVKIFLGRNVIKTRYTDHIVDADILKGLIVVECDLDKRTFTDHNAFEYYTKKKKVITDPNIKEMIVSQDPEMSRLGVELFEASLKTKKKK
jgi:hypothetical protein